MAANNSTGTVTALHVGEPEALGFNGAAEWYDEAWTSGIFKRPIGGPVAVGPLGLAGDGHADLVNHGGPDKAICVYPALHYPEWQRELANADFAAGAFGENLTLAGMTEADVCIGDIYTIGDGVLAQVSQPRQPCWKLARKWRLKDLTARAVASSRTGWYLRVLRSGNMRVGDTVPLQGRLHPAWTISAANLVMHHGVGDSRALASLPELAGSWRKTLAGRSQ